MGICHCYGHNIYAEMHFGILERHQNNADLSCSAYLPDLNLDLSFAPVCIIDFPFFLKKN